VNLSASIERGLAYVLSHQATIGFWSDWQLPPGESQMWTTAYVGYRLSGLCSRYGAMLDKPLMSARNWLWGEQFSNGGWGYSHQTGPDADSTSLALLFLGNHNDVAKSQRTLCMHQQIDGGFSTYTRDLSFGSWVQSHPDVTATALLALLPTAFSFTDEAAAGVNYLRNHKRQDGLWSSFWWTSCLYTTEMTLAFLRETRQRLDCGLLISSLMKIPIPTAFETALLLMCLTRLGQARRLNTTEHATALRDEQKPDGSWRGRQILRLTSREVYEPWNVADAGPLFADQNHLFTTATVLAALAALEIAREAADD